MDGTALQMLTDTVCAAVLLAAISLFFFRMRF